MAIADQLFYYGIYTFVWAALYWFLGLFKAHHLCRTTFQQINWTSAIHYLIITPLFLISILICPDPFGYDLRASSLLQHVMMAEVGYYIMAILHSFITGQKEKTGLIHHVAFGTVMIILLTWGEFPRFWMYIKIAQIPSILFHPLMAIAKSELVSRHFVLALERIHYKAYVFFRLFVQNLYGVVVFALDIFLQVSSPLVMYGIFIPVTIISGWLNWIWYKKAKQHLQKTEAEVLGSS